jgi:UDP-N-acetylmuramoyl-L-alanyl-D-glutamate--2,6-diaminopimelate ligase
MSYLTYADGAPADWSAEHVHENTLGSHFEVHAPGAVFDATLPMLGRHNVSNALAAMAATSRAGVPAASLRQHLATFRGVPARMQLIAAQPVRVIVDFANTPSRLQHSLRALRVTTARRLIVVTGSPDDARYVPDRLALGAVATQHADRVIFTEAGFRSVSPEEILRTVRQGASEAGRTNFEIVLDRSAAIRHALSSARAGDTVLIAGKGTEETIERGTTILPWNEAELVRALLNF